MKKKERKKMTNIMSYLCCNKTSVNDRFKQKPITLTCRMEAGFSKYTNFCSSEKFKNFFFSFSKRL